MSKKRSSFAYYAVLLALVLMAPPAVSAAGLGETSGRDGTPAETSWGVVKMRVFEGVKEGAAAPAKAVTASFLNYTATTNIQAEAELADQQARIRQVFSLKAVNLLTEGDLAWEKGKTDKAFHFFRIGDKDYLVMVTPVNIPGYRFRIEVFEQDKGVKKNLLDTEFSIPQKNAAVFGFADAAGKPYFVSFRPVRWPSETEAKAIQASQAIPSTGPVRATGRIQPPKPLKIVEPVYPEIARQSNVEGIVILEATTDDQGRVVKTKILRSIPLLDQAAMDAVKQWIYEPMMIDGKPRGIVFTVTCRFSLSEKKKASVAK